MRCEDLGVELRGQLSNPEVRERLELAEAGLGRSETAGGSCSRALRGSRLPRIRDRLDVDRMMAQFDAGVMIKELAACYGISESSVKRLLRSAGVSRR